MNSEWSRNEKLALYTLLTAIVGVAVALFIPEFRRMLGLNSEPSLASSSSSSKNTLSPESPIPASSIAPSRQSIVNVNIAASAGWVDTGIKVKSGERLTFEASGLVNAEGGEPNTNPNGFAPAVCDRRNCIAQGEAYGTLVGRIGGGNSFRVGTYLELTASSGGKLYLAVNDNDIYYADNKGSFTAHITKR